MLTSAHAVAALGAVWLRDKWLDKIAFDLVEVVCTVRGEYMYNAGAVCVPLLPRWGSVDKINSTVCALALGGTPRAQSLSQRG